jgi:hypothetical protein
MPIRAARGVLMLALALTVGCWMVVAGAEENRRYMVTGSLAALADLAASLVLTIIVLTAGWVSLSGLQVRQAVASAGRTVSLAAPHGLLLLAVGGWTIGLPHVAARGAGMRRRAHHDHRPAMAQPHRPRDR